MAKTVQVRLEEARTALHELLAGKAVVEVGYNGGVTKFARAEVANLRAYIRELEVEAGERRSARGSIAVRF